MNGSFCHTWLSHNLAYCPLANTNGWWLPPREIEGFGVASLAPTLNAHVAILLLGLGCICHLHVCFCKCSTLRSLGAPHNHVILFIIIFVVGYNLGLLAGCWSSLGDWSGDNCERRQNLAFMYNQNPFILLFLLYILICL